MEQTWSCTSVCFLKGLEILICLEDLRNGRVRYTERYADRKENRAAYIGIFSIMLKKLFQTLLSFPSLEHVVLSL